MAFENSMAMHLIGASAPTQPVNDLSPHVDGGQGTPANSNASQGDSRMIMHIAAAYVLLALLLLWLSGTIVLHGAKL